MATDIDKEQIPILNKRLRQYIALTGIKSVWELVIVGVTYLSETWFRLDLLHNYTVKVVSDNL